MSIGNMNCLGCVYGGAHLATCKNNPQMIYARSLLPEVCDLQKEVIELKKEIERLKRSTHVCKMDEEDYE